MKSSHPFVNLYGKGHLNAALLYIYRSGHRCFLFPQIFWANVCSCRMPHGSFNDLTKLQLPKQQESAPTFHFTDFESQESPQILGWLPGPETGKIVGSSNRGESYAALYSYCKDKRHDVLSYQKDSGEKQPGDVALNNGGFIPFPTCDMHSWT